MSCSSAEEKKSRSVLDEGDMGNGDNQEKYQFDSMPPEENESRLTYKEVGYTIKYVSALDFLERKGTIVEKEDIPSLEKETVIMVEFTSLNRGKKSPFDLQQCRYEKSKAIEFLAFQMEKNIMISQRDSIYTPNGMHFERDFGISDRLRTVAFFKGFDPSQDFQVIFKDQLFGGGTLRFVFDKHKLSS